MVNNCCVVGCTNYVGKKKKGLSFYRFPVAVRDGWLVCAEKTGNLNHIQESAMSILYQVTGNEP